MMLNLILPALTNAQATDWRSKAIELAIEEPKISDAKWSQDNI